MNSSLCSGCPLEGRPCVTPNRAGEQKGGLYILGGFPDARSATENGKGSVPFMGQRSNLIRSIMNKLYMRLPAGDKPTCYYGYACCCNPSYNRETKRYDISADIISRCANYARDFIDLQQPDVILAMGVDAYRALNIKGVVSAKRGTLEPFTDKNGRTVPVVCAYDLSTIVKNHGLVNVFVSDCQKALDVYYGTRNHTEPIVHCPVTVPEILAKLKNLEEGINRSQQEAVPVAFDTETTSLLPHVLEDRIIVMSFSWAKNKGLAFPFDHRKAPFTADERKAIQEAAERILNHPKVKLLMANGSFDMRYLWGRGITCPPQYWDVILAEHTLDEAKQGEYSLKDITRDRLPGYANYEEELKKIREVAWKDKDVEVRKLEDEAKEKTRQNLLEWWVGLDTATRIELLAKWAAAKYITVKDTAFLAEVKRVKRKGELVIPKKYLDSLSRMAKRLPDTEIPQEIVVEPDIPEELKFKSYEDIDLDTILRYAAMDVITTRMIYDIQLEEMRKSDIQDQLNRRKYGKEMSMLRPVGEAYMNITMPLSEQLARMQLHGIRMDRDRIREYQGILERKTEEVLDRMRTEIGVSFNPNSSADLVKILYEDLKLPILNYTDSGAPAVDKESLNNLADAHPDLNFLNDLLLYRRLSKTSGTYLKNWLDKSAYDGRLHTDFLQTGTATYRLSSSNPNLQNVPFSLKMGGDEMLNLKALFLPDEGYDIYDLDISNAEMRTLCAYSMDEHLIDAFNTGKDIHSLTGAGISSGRFTYEQICVNKEDKTTKEYKQRQVAKKVNFGTIYMVGAQTLKEQLWNGMRIDVTVEEAQHYLDQFFVTYPGVFRYINDTKNFADKHNFVYTYFGRRRRFPYAYYSRGDRERMHRQAVNARIQSTSSDIVMSCLIRVNKYLQSRNDGSCVLLTVHDSILFQAPHGAYTDLKSTLDNLIVEETRKQCPWLPVVWKYDVGWGPNYGDTHGKVD